MGQVLIRNLEEELLADYRAAAARNRRSLEAELREALRLARPPSPTRKAELLARLESIRAMTPRDVAQTAGWRLVREDRDR